MEEQLRILKMLEEGKVTAEEAAGLLAAVGDKKELTGETFQVANTEKDYAKRMFRVIVDSAEGDKVNIQIPIAAIRQILKVSGKIPGVNEKLEGVDLAEVMDVVIDCLDAQAVGDIVSVESQNGDIVKIYID